MTQKCVVFWKICSGTHVILCRRSHCDHHVALSHPLPRCRLLGHRNGHGQITSPRPKHGGVRDCHINVVAVLGKVRLPDGLERTEQFWRSHESARQRRFLQIYENSPAHLVDDSAGDSHAIEDGHVDDGGHPSIVNGLRAVRPHVWTLCQVNVARRKTAMKNGRVRTTWNLLPRK